MFDKLLKTSERYDTPEIAKEWKAINWIDKKLREAWVEENHEQVREFATEGFTKKFEECCNRGCAWYLDWLGRNEDVQQKFKDAETYYLEGLEFVKKDDFKEGIAHFYYRLQSIYRIQERHDAEINCCEQICLIYEEIGHENLSGHLRYLGNLYEVQGRYYEAEEAYVKVITLTEKEKPDLYRDLAYLYRKMGELDSSKKYLIQALHIYQDVCLNIEEANTMRMIGNVVRRQANFNEALSWFDRALQICGDSPFEERNKDYQSLFMDIHLDIAETKEKFGWSLVKREAKQ